MPTQFHEIIDRQASRIFEEKLGVKFKWKGSEYACAVTHGGLGLEIEEAGGYHDSSAITVTTLNRYFPGDRPEVRQVIEVEGKTWLIDQEPSVQAGTPLLILRCSRPDGVDAQVND